MCAVSVSCNGTHTQRGFCSTAPQSRRGHVRGEEKVYRAIRRCVSCVAHVAHGEHAESPALRTKSSVLAERSQAARDRDAAGGSKHACRAAHPLSSSPRCAGGWASSSAASSHASAHPPGAVHRRAAGRRRAAHAARPAHRRAAGASAALRAVRRLLPVPGRRDGWPAARKRARTPRVCRKAGAERGPGRDGAIRLIESRIVLELQSARGIRSAYGSIGT